MPLTRVCPKVATCVSHWFSKRAGVLVWPVPAVWYCQFFIWKSDSTTVWHSLTLLYCLDQIRPFVIFDSSKNNINGCQLAWILITFSKVMQKRKEYICYIHVQVRHFFFVHGGRSNVTCNYSDFRSTVVVQIKGDLGVRESCQTDLAISVFTFLATEFNEDLDTVLPYYLCSHHICQSSHKDCHLLVFEIIKL